MKIVKNSIYVLLGTIVVVSAVWFFQTHSTFTNFFSNSFQKTGQNLAAVFFRESTTIAQLNQKYKNAVAGQGKINVLIVPGHEPNFGGAEYGKLKEREMTVDLGNYLFEFLQKDGHFNTVITRDDKNWNSIFANYFANDWSAIVAFVANQKSQMKSLMDVGSVKSVSGAYHVDAPQDVALRLYGINKWANENKIDIEVHIHFNDYPRSHQSLPGKYTGMTIYVPEQQYSNSTTTRAIATAVLSRLSRYNAVSNLERESAGVVEDQDLIAVGSGNNADAASMLIEYGYIYEPQFQDSEIRDMTLKDLAYQTYLGIGDFFGDKNQASIAYDTLMLPHTWQKSISKTNQSADPADILALQSALVVDGEYPAINQSQNDCPRSGIFGNCTADALKAFQKKYNISGESGVVGVKTREVLNSMFGS